MAILLLFLLGASAPTKQMLASLHVLIDSSEYDVEIMESDDRGRDRSIHITCASGCPRPARYEDDAPGFPLGVFAATDLYPLIFTTWGGGSAYSLVVFAVGSDGIRKVFDRHSRQLPSFEVRGTRLTVETSEYSSHGAGTRRPLIVRSWAWDGQRFVEEGTDAR
jgi:hypothetical protein